VITRQTGWKPEGATVVHSLQDAIKAAADADYKEAFVIGGGEIFKESMAVADKIYLTRVDAALDGDAFFPSIDTTQWQMVSEDSHPVDAKHAYAYHFQVWEKIHSSPK
jgi:dihydrofolate reductase